MLIDDRLATVLRSRAASEAGLRTQFRQLLDLLGTRKTMLRGPAIARIARGARRRTPEEIDRALIHPAIASTNPRHGTVAGYVRLDEIMQALPQEEQSQILRGPGLRLRNPTLVAFLAEGDPKPAAAAMATARLEEDEWLRLIPELPVTARGFLRHRRNLSAPVKQLLDRLGIHDLALPMGEQSARHPSPITSIRQEDETSEEPPIRRLRRRIEAFQETRRMPGGPARAVPPARERKRESAPASTLDIVTDAEGFVTAGDGFAAPMLVGLRLTAPKPGALVSFGPEVEKMLARRLPLTQAHVVIDAAPDISGEWRMDAAPLFSPANGGFTGYAVRLYRPVAAQEDATSPADAMRQVLHELRTPVNAIQGFAEIIQQQLFGAVPHEYRAHAAAIAVDAAKLLAGFDEVDRLVKLDSDAMQLEEGQSDLRAALVETIRRLEGVLRPRNAGFTLGVSGSPFDVAIAREESLVLCWRLLATAAGAMGPGEEARIDLSSDGETIRLQMAIPQSLREGAVPGSRDPQRRTVISAGMFGPRFAFRLAEAEARSAGGSLDWDGDRVCLQVPVLTCDGANHSTVSDGGSG